MWIQTTNIISALANFLVDYFFIRHYGIVAASAGTFICYFLKYSILLILVRQLNKFENAPSRINISTRAAA